MHRRDTCTKQLMYLSCLTALITSAILLLLLLTIVQVRLPNNASLILQTWCSYSLTALLIRNAVFRHVKIIEDLVKVKIFNIYYFSPIPSLISSNQKENKLVWCGLLSIYPFCHIHFFSVFQMFTYNFCDYLLFVPVFFFLGIEVKFTNIEFPSSLFLSFVC